VPGLVAGRAAVTVAANPAGPALVSVATRSGMHKQGTLTVDTTGHTSHHKVEIVADSATDLRLRYGFWTWLTDPIPADSDITRIDAVLVLESGTICPVTFSAGSTLSFTPNGTIKPHYDSDVILNPSTGLPLVLARAAKPAIRSFCRASANTIELGVSWYSDTGTHSWYQAGNHLNDNPATPPSEPGPEYANSYYCHPTALLGVQS
jgi:hypothetical protein